ncbi:LptA/OstA family protein [Pseudochrobactrum kiredjianiae]|uniref:LptA/OstA family protein n=1 Tax=Pseudochrobactrum kiredjianiae TaxID=386305 RepID=A0ABW3V5U4_9HYPH|nr:LptA/OstA family protein [Pseudochrobactrum kiredjianiae]MDM7849819.1 LptA/OstA family protein [Pseudochrobactrum kiredjianiae]
MMQQQACSGLITGSQNKVSGKFALRSAGVKNFAVLFMSALLALPLSMTAAQAQQGVPLDGLKLSDSKDPVSIDAGKMEVRDKEGIIILTGNVSVKQGDIVLRAGRMQVYTAKSKDSGDKAKGGIGGLSGSGLNAGGIDKIVVDEKVYLKSGTQVATGDAGTYDAKAQTMVLTGKKVVLSDGDNIASGCKLTANTQSGKAFLESCKGESGRVSIILSPKDN